MSQAFYDSLQSQQLEWLKSQNFAKVEKHSPLLGMVEELGEFSAALASHVGDGLPLPVADMLDAVADFTIFLAHCCSMNERRLADVAADLSPFWPGNTLAAFTASEVQGKLARAQLKAEQNIAGGTDANIEKLFSEARRGLNLLASFAAMNGTTLAATTQNVWENVVSKRTAATQQDRSAVVAETPAPAEVVATPSAEVAQ